MLTYTIKKKFGFLNAMDNPGERWRNQERLRASNSLPVVLPGGVLEDEMDIPWNKLQYSLWYDRNVMGRFKVGDLVTPIYMKEQEYSAPFHHVITYINELHHTLKFSRKNNEPKCITVQLLNNSFIQKCPCELRLLTDKEKALVNLQNSKAQGTA